LIVKNKSGLFLYSSNIQKFWINTHDYISNPPKIDENVHY
jgi:hypothetical protein